MKLFISTLLLLISSASVLIAQNSQSYLNDVGGTAYGISIPVENGFINVSNGNLHLEFPLATHPQRGALNLNESLVYDSRIWMFSPFGTNGSYHWWPYNVPGSSTTAGGWRLITGNETGTVNTVGTQAQNSSCWNGQYNQPYQIYTNNYSWTDPSGTVHPSQAGSTTATVPTSCTGIQTGPTATAWSGNATDGSGYVVTAVSDNSGNVAVSVKDSSGTQVYPRIIDRFGNYWSSDSSGNLIDDTGRIPVITTISGNTTYYDVLSPNGTINNQGTRLRYTVTIASVPVSTYFQQSDTYEFGAPGVISPVQSILLPDGVSKYGFGYDSYGELSSVTLPTGGVITYGYSNFLDSSQTFNRWLTSRTVGNNPAMTFTPSVRTLCSNYSTGCVENVIMHKPSGDETLYGLTLNNGAWNTDMTAYTGAVTLDHIGFPSISATTVSQSINNNTYTNGCASVTQCVGANYLSQAFTTTALFANTTSVPGSQTVYKQSLETFNPTVGKISDIKDWEFVTTSPSTTTPPTTTPTRETQFTYTGVGPYQTTVLDSSGKQAALTTYGYTTTATATSGVAQHGSQNAGGPYLQSVSHWINTGVNSTTTYTMDDTGMVRSVVDANGNPPSAISYQCSNSLPYQNINPIGQTTQYGFDCMSGAIGSVQGPNDLANGRAGTTYKYEAVEGRIYTQTRPDGGVTTYTYPSANEVDVTTTATPDPSVKSVSIADAFGRPSASITAGTQVDLTYDVNGRAYCTSNPYTQGSTTSGNTCISSYDGLDRPLAQAQSDGTSKLHWSYSANTTNATNEVSQTWTRTVDSFSRAISVIEPGPLGSLATNYSYDGLGNVSKINQLGNAAIGDAARLRTFTYDSASRMVCASQPEAAANSCPTSATSTLPSGVLSYSYYPAGNAHTTTDARGIVTTYGYDQLNRPIAKSHSDGTVSSCSLYDSAPNGIGLLAQEWTQTGGCPAKGSPSNPQTATSALTYDAMGRLTSQSTVAPSATSTIGAMYDLAGNITSLTYPDGRTIANGFDGDGRVNSVSGKWNSSSAVQTYFSETNGYDAAGHLTGATFGNGIPYSAGYDNRERINCQLYGSTPCSPGSQSAPLWWKQYAWTPNNNLQSQTDLITGVQRQFNYDTLNRLTAAQDIYSTLAVASGSNDNTGSTSSSGSGASEMPGGTGALPEWTNTDDSNLLTDIGANNSNWIKGNAIAIPNSAAAPDGSMTATIVTATSASVIPYVQGPPATSSVDYSLETMTGSVWLKSGIGAAQTLNLYITVDYPGGWTAVQTKQVQLSTTWAQYQLTAVLPANTITVLWQIGGGGNVPANQGFFMWNPMLEDHGISGSSVTNFLPYSQRLTASTWTPGSTTTVVADNAVIAPDGTQTAASLTASSGTAGQVNNFVQNPAPFDGQSVTASVWLRAAAAQTVAVGLMEVSPSGTLAAISLTNVHVTTAWTRFKVSGPAESALSQLSLQIGGNNTVGVNQTVYVWGAQMELGSTPGPYVPTANAPVTNGTTLTNLLTYSQEPANWSPNSSIAVTPNIIAAPDGSMTGSRVTAQSADSNIWDGAPNAGLYDGATVTGSVYLKLESGSPNLNLYIYSIDAASGTTQYFTTLPVVLSSVWQRFEIKGTVPASVSYLVLQIGGATSFKTGQIIDLWGAQMEIASYAGPYIATTALPVITGSELTNILPSSQSISGTNWRATGTVSNNGATAPDGTTTAAIFTGTNGLAGPPASGDNWVVAFVPNPSLYDAETVTASVYLRVASGAPNVNLYLDTIGDQGTLNPTSVAKVTTTWQRFDLTGTLQNGLTSLSFQIGGGNSLPYGTSIQIWGAQFVIGSNPAPYTPTSTTTTVYATGAPGTPVPTGLTQVYSYDSFGNILQNGSFNSTYTVNNQMFGYSYDTGGNLLSDGINIMTWDAESRMSTVGGATYIYDAEGNRVEKQGSSIVDTVYFGGQPIARYSNGQWTDLIYGPSGILAEILGQSNAAAVYRVTDNLGTNVGLLVNGAFVNPIDHTPFGQVFTGNTSDPYFYTGLERDGESSFDHAIFRQYSSNSGRWTSPDPYSGSMDVSNPQSLNRYNYVGNNPLSYVDPSGLDDDNPDGNQSNICFICIIDDIESLFFHPSLTASHTPRPNAQIWDEHGGFHVNPNEGIGDILGLPQAGCEFGACGSSFTDYNQSQTRAQLQQAYDEATAGRIKGLLNIRHNSNRNGPYDYGYNQPLDTWNFCGTKLNASEFGNFIAGFQAAAYDANYFYTTGGGTARLAVYGHGVVFHLFGDTQAENDPLDLTGIPAIHQGAKLGGRYTGLGTGCGG